MSPVATMAPLRPLPLIRPITDLRQHLNEVCEQAKAAREPIIFTKNGTAAFVLMDAETYEEQQQANRVFLALREAEIEEEYNPKTYTMKEVDDQMREIFALWGMEYQGLKGKLYD